MAFDYSSILDTASIAGVVYNITNDYKSAGVAAGYGAFVRSVTGSNPIITQPQSGRALVSLSPTQAATIRDYVARTAKTAMSSSGPLSIDFNPVIAPTAIKYGIIAALAAGTAGFLLAKYL